MRTVTKGKILIIRRSYLAAIALCLAVVAIFYVIYNPFVAGGDRREAALPIYSVMAEGQTIALTFNLSATVDTNTQRVLDALENQGVLVTFFVTGQWVRANAHLAEQIVAAGHELMNLSDDHSLLRRLNFEQLQENLAACSLAIYEISGRKPSLFRAPYGEYDSRLVEMANALGMQAIQWSIDSGDWRGLSADHIVEQILSRSFSGGIVLLHSNLPQTALSIPHLLERLQAEGYEIVLLSELIYQGEYVGNLHNS